jgi:hypothetical protein
MIVARFWIGAASVRLDTMGVVVCTGSSLLPGTRTNDAFSYRRPKLDQDRPLRRS